MTDDFLFFFFFKLYNLSGRQYFLLSFGKPEQLRSWVFYHLAGQQRAQPPQLERAVVNLVKGWSWGRPRTVQGCKSLFLSIVRTASGSSFWYCWFFFLFFYQLGSTCKVWPELSRKFPSWIQSPMQTAGQCHVEVLCLSTAQHWSWNHAFLKSRKRGSVPESCGGLVLPLAAWPEVSAEQEGGPVLMHSPTFLSLILYFLGRLTCMPFFLTFFPISFYIRSLCSWPFHIA